MFLKFLLELLEFLIELLFRKKFGDDPAPVVVVPAAAPAGPPAQGWSKDILDCNPAIQKAYPKVKSEFESAHPDCTLKVDYTYRGPEMQMDLFKKGRTLQNGQWIVTDPKLVVTEDDGTVKKSHHNTWPANAADIYVVKNGNVLWGQTQEEMAYYIELGRLWEQQGLVSGATWKFSWKDPDHVQVG